MGAVSAYFSGFKKRSVAKQTGQNYTESDIRSLDWKEHIRLRPGMYIGKLGDGASADDGIYCLLYTSDAADE